MSPFQSCLDLRLAPATEPEQTLPQVPPVPAAPEAAETRGPVDTEPEQALPPVPAAPEAAETCGPIDTEPEQGLPPVPTAPEAAEARGPKGTEPEQALPPVPTAPEAADTRGSLDTDETQLDTQFCEVPTAGGALDPDSEEAQLGTKTCELEGFPSVDMEAGNILTRRMQHGLVHKRRADSLLQTCLPCMHMCRQIWQMCIQS